jgi:hypothetical protein
MLSRLSGSPRPGQSARFIARWWRVQEACRRRGGGARSAPNTLTFHFDRLRTAGLVSVRREGRLDDLRGTP